MKKAQITIFVILGIVIVIALFFVFSLSRKTDVEKLGNEINFEGQDRLFQYVDLCLEDTVKGAVEEFGYLSGNTIKAYVEQHIEDCTDLSFFNKTMKLDYKSPEVTVVTTEKAIEVLLNFPIYVGDSHLLASKSEYEYTLQIPAFSSKVDLPLDEKGFTKDPVTIITPDKHLVMQVPKGVQATDKDGNVVRSLELEMTPFSGSKLLGGTNYEFKPDGTKISDYLIMYYDYSWMQLDPSVDIRSIGFVYNDSGTWVDYPCLNNVADKRLMCFINQFYDPGPAVAPRLELYSVIKYKNPPIYKSPADIENAFDNIVAKKERYTGSLKVETHFKVFGVKLIDNSADKVWAGFVGVEDNMILWIEVKVAPSAVDAKYEGYVWNSAIPSFGQWWIDKAGSPKVYITEISKGLDVTSLDTELSSSPPNRMGVAYFTKPDTSKELGLVGTANKDSKRYFQWVDLSGGWKVTEGQGVAAEDRKCKCFTDQTDKTVQFTAPKTAEVALKEAACKDENQNCGLFTSTETDFGRIKKSPLGTVVQCDKDTTGCLAERPKCFCNAKIDASAIKADSADYKKVCSDDNNECYEGTSSKQVKSSFSLQDPEIFLLQCKDYNKKCLSQKSGLSAGTCSEAVNIVIFGDSITKNVGICDGNDPPSAPLGEKQRFVSEFKKTFPNAKIIVSGVTGEKPVQAKARITELTSLISSLSGSTTVVLWHGANSVTDYETSYSTIIEELLKTKVQIVIMTPLPKCSKDSSKLLAYPGINDPATKLKAKYDSSNPGRVFFADFAADFTSTYGSAKDCSGDYDKTEQLHPTCPTAGGGIIPLIASTMSKEMLPTCPQAAAPGPAATACIPTSGKVVLFGDYVADYASAFGSIKTSLNNLGYKEFDTVTNNVNNVNQNEISAINFGTSRVDAVAGLKSDIVLLWFGTTDNGKTDEEIKAQQSIIDALKSSVKTIIVLTPVPVCSLPYEDTRDSTGHQRCSPDKGKGYSTFKLIDEGKKESKDRYYNDLEVLSTKLKTLADSNKLNYIDIRYKLQEEIKSQLSGNCCNQLYMDGIVPSSQGYQIIADYIATEIKSKQCKT